MCESSNPLFDELSLICVRPEIGAARLLVTLSTRSNELDEVRRALMSARGFFRAHLARDLSRKKVPQLSFAVIPASCAESELYD